MTETNKMTKELHLKLVEAWWEGNLEVFDPLSQKWSTAYACVWANEPPSRYRIRPQPRLRPWKPEEVPVGAQVRYAGNLDSVRMLIITNLGDALLGGGGRWTVNDLFLSMEHSLDGGKTWLPCGTLEESQ